MSDENSPFFYHKTTRRELYDSEREKGVADGLFEVLFTNSRGEVTEGSITNIFILKDNTIFSPPLVCGLLDGVFRKYFLKNCPLPVEEKVLSRQDVAGAEAIFVGNSVRGLIQVELG